MNRGALILGAGVAALLAYWRGRPAEELAVELEELAGMSPTAAALLDISREPNVAAFLGVIRYGEGTESAEGYRALYGYHPKRNRGALFETYAEHPRIAKWSAFGWTTAAGAYQILARSPLPGGGETKIDTWGEAQRALELPDFSPASQDVAAVWLIRRRGALADVRAGRFDVAVEKVAREWASLPGSPYGQPLKTLDQVRQVYAAAGGTFA